MKRALAVLFGAVIAGCLLPAVMASLYILTHTFREVGDCVNAGSAYFGPGGLLGGGLLAFLVTGRVREDREPAPWIRGLIGGACIGIVSMFAVSLFVSYRIWPMFAFLGGRDLAEMASWPYTPRMLTEILLIVLLGTLSQLHLLIFSGASVGVLVVEVASRLTHPTGGQSKSWVIGIASMLLAFPIGLTAGQ
jgi:hypothetical protein